MTRELLNTLYIQTQDAQAFLKDDTVRVVREGETLIRVPLHHLGSICAFGVVHLSSPLMMRCAEDGRAVVFFDHAGRFKARITGKTGGNILLRSAQWEAATEQAASLAVARAIVAGKIQNSRQVLLRAARDHGGDGFPLVALELEAALRALPLAQTHDELRGAEGIAAQAYYSVFDQLIRVPRADFAFDIRSRRPPRNRSNALLSFLYSIGTSDCVAALEGVGLDPQLGFLHVMRPGRPALALDLIEEFRSVVFDRLALSLINRRLVTAKDFEEREGGSWFLSADGRKTVLAALQKRKQIEVRHGLFKEPVPIGLISHIQARVLARHLRGDIAAYLPYMPQ